MSLQSIPYGLRSRVALFIFFGVSACGGGGGDGGTSEPVVVDPASYQTIANRSTTVDTVLVFLGTTNEGALQFGTAGTLDHSANTIVNGTLAGTTNNGRTEIVLDGAGLATLTNPTGTDYLRLFETQGAGPAVFGVIGQQTGPSSMPDSGTTNYSGDVALTVADGGTLRSLTGDATISAAWAGGGSATATFDSFRENGSGVSGQIEITDAEIVNSGFRGGNLSTTGSLFDVTGSADISGTRGYFFGPDAAEVGGTLVIDDSAGSLEVVGVFSAKD